MFNNSDFKAYKSIENIDRLKVCITQKIHGTNAQFLLQEKFTLTDINVGYWYRNISGIGSRTRWLTKEDDNYGFFSFILDNQIEFRKLPEGRYYGEWCGKGINSGEGLEDRKLVLFNHNLDPGLLPPQTVLVPVLFEGEVKLSELNELINDTMQSLKTKGSILCPGFMQPEGIVISINNKLYKKVFKEERKSITRVKQPKTDFDYLCQPLRLEKLLSRDQRNTYVENIVETVKAYFDDLIKENEISGAEEEIQKVIKAASRQIFNFIKGSLDELSGNSGQLKSNLPEIPDSSKSSSSGFPNN